MTIVVLVVVSRGSTRRRVGAPAALGTPYEREERCTRPSPRLGSSSGGARWRSRSDHTEKVFENIRGVRDTLSVQHVFGDPYEADGCMIIPVAKVMGGAGKAEQGNREGESGAGYGTGFGLQARPVGVYQVRGGEVLWKPAVDVTRLAKGGQALAALVAVCITLIALTQRSR